MFRTSFCLLLFWLYASNVLTQTILKVPYDYPTIQSALDASNDGTTIIVSPGTYHEQLIWPNFDGIKLIGEGGKEQTIIEPESFGKRVIMMASDQDFTEATVLEGFTVQGGIAREENGAGLYFSGGSATFKDLKFYDNNFSGDDFTNGTYKGMGAYLDNFSGTITNCEFIDNSISNFVTSNKGVGLWISVDGEATISNCLFEKNYGSGDSGEGCGLYVEEEVESTVNVIGCRFIDNELISTYGSSGAGLHLDVFDAIVEDCIFLDNFSGSMGFGSGGGIGTRGVNIKVRNCIFENNKSNIGAAINFSSWFSDEEAKVENCRFISNKVLDITNTSQVNCIIHFRGAYKEFDIRNSLFANNIGSTIISSPANNNEIIRPINLSHCTFANNSKGITLDNNLINISNSIFWKNGEEELIEVDIPSEILMQNCLVFGGYIGENIIDSDPIFRDTIDFIPRNYSPCIEAGILTDILEDIDGNLRPLPANTLPDIGAYEVDQSVTAAHNTYKLSIKSYPNPATSNIYFEDPVEKLSIYDAHGKLVSAIQLTQEIDVRQFEPGTYFVEYQKDGKVGKDTWVIFR